MKKPRHREAWSLAPVHTESKWAGAQSEFHALVWSPGDLVFNSSSAPLAVWPWRDTSSVSSAGMESQRCWELKHRMVLGGPDMNMGKPVEGK